METYGVFEKEAPYGVNVGIYNSYIIYHAWSVWFLAATKESTLPSSKNQVDGMAGPEFGGPFSATNSMGFPLAGWVTRKLVARN